MGTVDLYTIHITSCAIIIIEVVSVCCASQVSGKYLITFLIQEVCCAINSSPVGEDEEPTLWQILV